MDWQRHAIALDLWLAGRTYREIGDYLGISRERARQIIVVARHRLAYRVFGTPKRKWIFNAAMGRWTQLK